VLACDFFVTVTATFRMLYIFIVLEVGTRRILHWNVTEHPTAEWTAQQFRMAVPGDQPHRFVVYDNDNIYSQDVDRAIAAMGLIALKTPVRATRKVCGAPLVGAFDAHSNAVAERFVRTIRQECLGWLLILNALHLERVLRVFTGHYNTHRVHRSLDLAPPNGRSAIEPLAGMEPIVVKRPRSVGRAFT
jgi:transposase InsO family protein